MSSAENYPELPHGFDCLDPVLLSTPSTPPHNVHHHLQYPENSTTYSTFNLDDDLQPQFESVNPSHMSSNPASPTHGFDNQTPFSRHGNLDPISPQLQNLSQDQFSVQRLDSFPYSLFSESDEPLTIQSACPSPALPAFELFPQQARAISQPPEEHAFGYPDDVPAPATTQSMSFHRIVRPRGKRSHTYFPYSRQAERNPKRATQAKKPTPTSAPTLVSLGYPTLVDEFNHDGTNPRGLVQQTGCSGAGQSYQIGEFHESPGSTSETRLPRSSISASDHSRPSSPEVRTSRTPYAKPRPMLSNTSDILQATKPDSSQWQLADTTLSLALSTRIQSLAQMCSEMQCSLQQVFDMDGGKGDFQQKIDVERERFAARVRNCDLTKLHESFAILPRLPPNVTSHEEKSEGATEGDDGVRPTSQSECEATDALPRNGLDIRRLDHTKIHHLLDSYRLPYSPDQYLHEKKLLYMRFLGLGKTLMHRVLD